MDALAEETLALARSLGARPAAAPAPAAPVGAGVLYSIRRDGDTFLLRGSATDDLGADGGGGGAHAFPTDLAEQARTIVEEMTNRRFPMDEDMVVSLGELSPGWRMERSPGSLSVHFKAHGRKGGREPELLGPIGDGRVASRCLAGLRDVLARGADLEDFHCNERSLRAVCAGEAPLLGSLADLFLEGRPLPGGVFEAEERTLELFLGEVAAKRRFWLDVRGRMPPPLPSLSRPS